MDKSYRKQREKSVKIQASVPAFVKIELERLAKAGFMTESRLISLMIINALPWAKNLIEPKDKQEQPKRSGE